MSIGMTYDEFWYGDSELVKVYYRAHKYKVEQRNQEMWVQGMYICSALQSTVGNMFRKKGTKPIEYLKEPIRVFPKTEKELQAEAERERIKAIESFKRLQKAVQVQVNEERKCQ